MNKRFAKSRNKKLFGVAGGLAEYFDVDPSPVRVLVVVLTLILWFVPVVYIVLAIWMPKPEEADS
jgi:phage shock protein C